MASPIARPGATSSTSSRKPATALGAYMIHAAAGRQQPATAEALLAHPRAMAVLMHSRNAGPRAEAIDRPHRDLIPEIIGFFRRRTADLETLGLQRERIILDPGMGYFLGGNPQPSLHVLRHLEDLLVLGQPVYVSTSRKSFIAAVLGKDPPQRGTGTLATELWAIEHAATFIRTHDIPPIAPASRLWRPSSAVYL